MPAPLLPLTIQAPGFKGVNTEESALELDTGWATKLVNATFSETGTITSRKGHSDLSSGTDFVGNEPASLFCFEREAGTMLISAGNNNGTHSIYKGTTSLTDITGTITTATGSNWQFVGFIDASDNEKIIGVQEGHKPIVSNDGAAFADIVGTAIPATGKCIHSAFGRLWSVLDDGITLNYSSLLDETDWSTTGGTLALGQYWPGGVDHATAITSWENKLVVFGQHSIIIYQSPDVIGNIALWDTVAGLGCVARDSVQAIGSDVLFLSESGMRSLRKTITEGKVPISDVASAISTELNELVDSVDGTTIKSVYSLLEGFYLLIFPTVGTTYCFDVQNIEINRNQVISSTQVRISKWEGAGIYSAAYGRDEITYFGVITSSNGQTAKYDTFNDGASATYTLKYTSPWIDLSSEQTPGTWKKIVKKINTTITGNSSYILSLMIEYNFGEFARTFSDSIQVGSEDSSDWGVAKFGEDEWGGSQKRSGTARFNVSGDGQFIRLSVESTIDGYELSINQLDMFLKRGRLSR